MSMPVKVLKRTRYRGEEVYFTAYCTRCQREVHTANTMRRTTYEWATKAAAVKNAQAHANMHVEADKRFAANDFSIFSRAEVVADIEPNNN